MTHLIRRAAERVFGSAGLPVFALLAAATFAGPALATVQLRVEGRPADAPIQAFVRVTNAGVPVTGLTAADFAVKIDGVAVDLGLPGSSVTLPPAEDPNQHVTVVFAMDYTSSVLDVAEAAMVTAIGEFVDAMKAGDTAAIVKFNNDSGPSAVIAFTTIDDGGPNDQLLHAAIGSAYPGDGSNILDATNFAVAQFVSATLPAGPKAVILIT